MDSGNKKLAIMCGLLFLAVWGLRISALQSAFQGDDSPETAAACATLGIQHPPGYPLPTLAGRAACLVFPGNPAMRLNFLASFFSCLCPILLLFIGRRLSRFFGEDNGPARAWPWMTALGFAGMQQLAYQASSAKGGIYTLNLFLTFLAWFLFWEARQNLETSFKQSVKYLRLGFLSVGLGLAGHFMSLVLFVPTFLALIFPVARRRKNAVFWVWSLLPLLAGISLYLYLPLRAGLNPAMNWGQPDSWGRLWDTLTRSQYQAVGRLYDFEQFTILSAHFLKLLPPQIFWLGMIPAAWGLRLAWIRRPLFLRSLVFGLGLHLAAVILYNNPPKSAPWVTDAFFLPDFALLWLFAVPGGLDLFKRLSGARVRALAGALALAALSLGLALSFGQADYSRDFLAYDYGRNLLAGLPERSVLLAAGGGDAFPVWYLQNVEGRRPDLLLVDVPLYSLWYRDQLKAKAPDVELKGKNRDEMAANLLGAKLARPLFYTSHNPGDVGVPFGLVTRVPNGPFKMSLAALDGPWEAMNQRAARDRHTPLDGNREELMEYYPLSAKALREFGERQGLKPVAEMGGKWEKATAFH